MGASSGLGKRLAEKYILAGWKVGLAARNIEKLKAIALDFKNISPRYFENIEVARIDITQKDAPEKLEDLIGRLGGMNVYLHCSGILADEESLSEKSQNGVIATNAVGFARMVSAAYRYFRDNKESDGGRRQIAAVSSIAGIRGLSQLPAYSASKAFDTHYLEALRQRADAERLDLTVTDIKPGWTRTPLLSSGRRYMMEMDESRVVEKIFKAIENCRSSSVIGKRWKILTAIERVIPSLIWTRLHLPLWRDS